MGAYRRRRRLNAQRRQFIVERAIAVVDAHTDNAEAVAGTATENDCGETHHALLKAIDELVAVVDLLAPEVRR